MGERYSVVHSGGASSLQADMDRVAASCSTDAKVVIVNAKAAVERASLAVFGEALTADARNDIPLKAQGKLLGGVDCLFTGPTLHVLLLRKRRLSAAHGTSALN